MLTIHNMCGGMIDRFGTEEQRAEWLPKLTSLEVMASYCLTEPGSDASSLISSAELSADGSHYTLNGGKAFISGAGLSNLYVVMCRTGGIKGPKGVTCLLVPATSEGLSFGSDEKKMGWKVQPTRQVMFDNVKVPVGNRLGSEGLGFKMAMAGLDGGRLSIAACSLGAAQASFEIALAYTKERKQFGKSISDYQATQFRLADMAAHIHSSRLVLRQAAQLLDDQSPLATVHCAMAKKLVTDMGSQVCNEALQLLGGYGYLKDYHIERYVRDVRVHQILEGTNEVMRMIIGRGLVG
jgi:alkylation response protein AidB-like acyl-CoA dehydrogenase